MKKRLISGVLLALLIVATFSGCGDKENGETTTETTTEAITETTTETTTAEETTASAENYDAKLSLYYSTGTDFKELDITSYTGDLETAKVFSTPSEVEKETTNKVSIRPEFRLYGIPKEAKVSVLYESDVTKAKTASVRYNEGVESSFFYWSVKMYDTSLEGEYSFKITIHEEGKAEQYIYYKIAVQK